MKNTTIGIITLGLLNFITSCTTIEHSDPAMHSSATTTEQTTVADPYSRTVQTKTTRTY